MGRISLVLVLLAMSAPLSRAESMPPLALRSVQFVDEKEGWAAGDAGWILHTIDGGLTWERQSAGTAASICGLHFLTPYTGWAVGRTDLPGPGSAGVVLATTDGGLTWTEHEAPLPGLRAVQFLDATTGFTCGDGTAAFPTGVYRTTTGGRTWKPLAGPRAGIYTALACPRVDIGLVLGSAGICQLRGETLTPLRNAPAQAVCGSVLQPGGRMLVAGPDRQVHRLLDPAGAWETVRIASAPGELRSISAAHDTVVAVGRCGRRVFVSTDFGATWSARPVPTSVPLNAVHMVTPQFGVAVGELGTLIRTTDGGTTWHLMRAGGQRAAVLIAVARPEQVPLGLVAKLAAEGYHVVAATTSAHPDAARLSSAMQAVGGAGAEVADPTPWPHFRAEAPASRTPEMLARLESTAAVERFVFALRTWQPDMVLTVAAAPTAPTPEALMGPHLTRAVEQAANPEAFPEHHTTFGLQPHQVMRLMAVDPDGTHTEDLTAFDAILGASAHHHAEAGCDLFTPPIESPALVKLRSVLDRAPTPGGLMAGLALPAGGTARRPAPDRLPSPEWLAQRENLTAQRQALDAHTAGPAGTEEVKTTLEMLTKMPGFLASRAAATTAQHYERRGAWTAAREVWHFVAEHHPLQPEAALAVRWLARFHASGEFARRTERGDFPIFQTRIWDAVPPPTIARTGLAALSPSQAFEFRTPDARKSYLSSPVELVARLAPFGAAFTHDPLVNTAAAVAYRKIDHTANAEATLKTLLAANRTTPPDATKRRLAAELNLLFPESDYTDSTFLRAACPMIREKPFLDGDLTDANWTAGAILPLTHWAAGNNQHPTHARLTSDGQFLYVGITAAAPVQSPFVKSEVVNGQDRVELLIDLDRDYSTYYRIRVAANGVSDADCTGDPTWKSGHFVAVKPLPTSGWTAELAIPLSALTPDGAWGAVWGVNVVRVVPGVTAGGWAGPTDGTPDPTTLGHLRFPPKPRLEPKSTSTPPAP